jgi:CRISPR-associated protein Cas8b1/Cst1 subtype I-B
MEITPEKFVEQYNRCMDWNAELRYYLPIGIIESHEDTRAVLDDFLSIEKITPESYDIYDAKVYKDEKSGNYEMQVYSNIDYAFVYFMCTIGQSEKEYKEDRIKVIYKYVTDLYKDAVEEEKKAHTKLEAAHSFSCCMYNLAARNNVNI